MMDTDSTMRTKRDLTKLYPDRQIAACMQDEIKQELAAQKVFLQGPDKHGRGVLILKGARHSKSKRDLEELKRFICYCLDNVIKQHDLRVNPEGKGVAIFDLRGGHLSDCPLNCIPAEPGLHLPYSDQVLQATWPVMNPGGKVGVQLDL